ncbi:glycoside hydrolase family 97 N-terminal domain-containing protein, partial [bacterium]|nr:glycoside hydrolase family 97 N-terminal domain-containing protein [bacterium]
MTRKPFHYNAFSLILILFSFITCMTAYTQPQTLHSPDGRLTVTFTTTNQLSYAFQFNGQTITTSSPISLTLNDCVLGKAPKLLSAETQSKMEEIDSPLNIHSKIRNEYNQLVMTFDGSYALEARAYNDGWAYRFVVD